MNMKTVLIRMIFLAVFVWWLMVWVLLPTKRYKHRWTPVLDSNLNSTYFGVQGTNLLLFTFPMMFIAALGCVYLHVENKSENINSKSTVVTRRHRLAFWRRPVLVMAPLGIVTAVELAFAAMFVALLIWSLSNYLYVSFGHLHMHKAGEKVWQAKFRSVSLRLGYVGNICWAFLFFPVTRGSSILPLFGLTSESSIKYHIWLGHLSMILFASHTMGFIIYWAITHQMSQVTMSTRGGKTKGQKRPLIGDNSQLDGDIRNMIKRLVPASTRCPHDDTQYELESEDLRIVAMQPVGYIRSPDTPGTNPYSRPGNMDQGTTSEATDIQPQLPTHRTGGDVGDSHDLPLPDSQEVPLPDSHEVPPSESEDIPHSEDLVLPELKENELWTIDENNKIEVLDVSDSRKLNNIPEGKRVIVQFTGSAQPIGKSGVRWRRTTGKMIRSGSFIRISDDWKKVSEEQKEIFFTALMKQFYILPGSDIAGIKKDLWRDMSDKLKYWRSELKHQLKIGADDTPDTVKARAEEFLKKYKQDDVDILLDKWCDKKNKEYVAHMKHIRELNITPHCAGSKSYAMHSHDKAMKTGKTPTRAENYIATHQKKGGGYPNTLVAERVAIMERLAESDPAASAEGPSGTLRWTPNDAYAQAHGNKPEYAGRVRGVSKNVLPARGSIHSYYTPSPARSQNTPSSAVVSEMIAQALTVRDEQHKQEMEERLTQQREQLQSRLTDQMEERLARQKEEHRLDIDAITKRFVEQMAAYDARFRSLEGGVVVTSEPEVTMERAVHDLGSPARPIVGSSADSTHDDDHNEPRHLTPVGQKSRLSKTNMS